MTSRPAGAVLGLLDGLGTYAYPAALPAIAGIIMGSTMKGFLTGLPVGLILSWFVAANGPLEGGYYYWEIMLPGGAVGAIVAYATWKFGRVPQRQAQ